MSTNGWGDREDWRDTEFGHGQERYYGGEHAFPPARPDRPTSVEQQSAPRGGPRKGPFLAGAGVLVVALTAGGVYLSTRGGADSAAAGPATTRPTASIATGDGSASASSHEPQRNAGGDADHAAFEVPPPGRFTTGKGAEAPVWRMYKDPRDVAGYGSRTGKNLTLGHAPTHYRSGFCRATPESALGLMVWAAAHGDPPQEAASDGGDTWLKAIATRDDNTMEKYSTAPTVKNVTVDYGRTKAVQFRGRTPLTAESERSCGVTGAEVVVTAFDTGHGTATLVTVRRLGHPDSMSNAQLSSIVSSLRPT